MSIKMETISGGASLTPPPQSPSFNAFSSENIADVAARVVKELNLSHADPFDDDFYSAFEQVSINEDDVEQDDNNDEDEKEDDDDEEEEEEESEFEFAILNREDNISPISADEIFSNGQIRPIYPVFNTDLLYGHHNINIRESETATIRVPLRKFFEERESGSGSGSGNGVVSCSSSEADDELEGVPAGTYCVWTPKKKEEIMIRKKSKSTSNTTNGSSRRWKFLNLLHRSNSDGKDTFVFLTPSNNGNGNSNNQKSSTTTMVKSNSNGKKMMRKGEEKRKSYLPYRQDLVGFFANVNGISRTVRPF